MRAGKVSELFVYDNFSRVPVEEVAAGDICAVTGVQDVSVRAVQCVLCVCKLCYTFGARRAHVVCAC